jgi:hypothetical protein
MKYDDNVECCANCKWLEQTPRNNRYGDTDNFCIYLGYYCTGIYKDRNKVRHFTPGGRELKCNYERKSKRTSETDTGEMNANL